MSSASPKKSSVVEPAGHDGNEAARLRAILDSALDGIISIDRTGRITAFNHAAERMFGYREDEILGKDVSVLMPPPYRDEHAGYLEHFHKTGVPKTIGWIREVEGLRCNGEIFPLELAVSEASVADVPVYCAILRDVSERRRMQAEIERLDREARRLDRQIEIGAVTSKLIHDLGNPVGACTLQAELLERRALRGDLGQADTAASAQKITVALRRIRAIVDDGMDFVRTQRLRQESLRLLPFLSDIATAWLPQAANHGVAMKLEVDPSVQSVYADAVKMRRVFDNLIGNALDAMGGKPGSLTIRAFAPDALTVHVIVEDDGPGIPRDFDPFALFRTTKPNGTGLGLAIASEIVKAHGGSIRHSPAVPHGAVFTVKLPQCEVS